MENPEPTAWYCNTCQGKILPTGNRTKQAGSQEKKQRNLLQRTLKPIAQVKCNSDVIKSTGCYRGWGSDWRCAFGRMWVEWRGSPLRLSLIANNCLHHEGILKVTDVVAVLRLALVDACERNGVRQKEVRAGNSCTAPHQGLMVCSNL